MTRLCIFNNFNGDHVVHRNFLHNIELVLFLNEQVAEKLENASCIFLTFGLTKNLGSLKKKDLLFLLLLVPKGVKKCVELEKKGFKVI